MHLYKIITKYNVIKYRMANVEINSSECWKLVEKCMIMMRKQDLHESQL